MFDFGKESVKEANKMLAEYRKHSRSCVEDAVHDFGRDVVMAWVEDSPERDDSPDCMDIARDFRLAEGQ